MTTKTKTSLSLEEVALLADRKSVPPETAAKLAALIRACPLFEEQLAKLDAMAKVVGARRLEDALSAHRNFDRLLEETWKHPSEVVSGWIFYGELISIAEAKAAEAEGAERKRFLALRQRLIEVEKPKKGYVPKYGGGLMGI